MEWVQVPELGSPLVAGSPTAKGPPADGVNNVTIGIVGGAPSQPQNAFMPTSAIVVDVAEHIIDPIAQEQNLRLNERIGSAPKFWQQFVWDPDPIVCSKTVRWTEMADPLPSPPPREFLNSKGLGTIQSHPELFAVSTPIDVNHFKSLLSSHPNQLFVQSVCRGLHKGFWPYADTHYGDWPLTWDNSQQPIQSEEEGSFLRSQVQKEVDLGWYSPSFGPELLPGIYVFYADSCSPKTWVSQVLPRD